MTDTSFRTAFLVPDHAVYSKMQSYERRTWKFYCVGRETLQIYLGVYVVAAIWIQGAL